jgi:hypothetical protein
VDAPDDAVRHEQQRGQLRRAIGLGLLWSPSPLGPLGPLVSGPDERVGVGLVRVGCVRVGLIRVGLLGANGPASIR